MGGWDLNPFSPGTAESDLFTLDTPEGRRHLFNKRIDQLMQSGLSLDQSLHEMRTGGNPDDDALLSAMGETPSLFRTQRLHQDQHVERLNQLAKKNADASKTSAEVASALKASNDRSVAFNCRITELRDRGFTTDQAIMQMRANPHDAELLKAMGAA